MTLIDQGARQQALKPTISFIVQAPAGSGKTELLTQRLLVLLANAVNDPEDIIALTFTRKAAREMRERVLDALKFAANNSEPTEPHRKQTWQLAQAVLKQDQKQQWHLTDNPNRLNIMTIDSLTAMINAKTPLLSQVGSQPRIADDAQPYYEEAAESLLDMINQSSDITPSLNAIFLHCDNKANTVIQLLSQLLAKRQQWLPYVMQQSLSVDELQQTLEDTLQSITLDTMTRIITMIDPSLWHQIQIQCQIAAETLANEQPEHPATCLVNLPQPLSPCLEHLSYWQQIAGMLISNTGQWRKSLTKRHGFTAKSAHKQAMSELIALLQNNHVLAEQFHEMLLSPPQHYQDSQWNILQALLDTLPHLVAHLTLVFQRHNVIDFSELTLAALRALGDTDQPTDLALYLDNHIIHLLVDEFQDTSIAQYHLLQRLTTDWQSGDGRTAFFVGDPMQSIYRFRNAEVALFLHTQQQGFGNITLTPLHLQMNFRSCGNIVNWVNTTFSTIFPAEADSTYGAVPLSPAVSAQAEDSNSVYYHTIDTTTSNNQGKAVAEQILAIQQQYPNESIALLIRSRNQLRDLLPEFQQRQIAVQATDIDPLLLRPEIQDLLSLTRALLSINDRVAWLAVLRSPCCGLSLSDLLIISQAHPKNTLWFSVTQTATIEKLSSDGQRQLHRLLPILTQAMNHRGRRPLSHMLKYVWLSSGCAQCLNSNKAYKNCQTFFQLIVDTEQQQPSLDIDLLHRKVQRLFAQTDQSQTTAIQIMTIHKSKGLEFDHVLLPHLESGSANASPELLKWQEHTDINSHASLVLAPIKASSDARDPIYDYIKRSDNKKSHFEMQRLLYVAVTRAKRSLHLFASVDKNDKGEWTTPRSKSLLGMLWPPHQDSFVSAAVKATTSPSSQPIETARFRHHRLASDWIPDAAHPLHLTDSQTTATAIVQQKIPFEIGSKSEDTQRIIGISLHQQLQHISRTKQVVNSDEQHHLIKRSLTQQHIAAADLSNSIALIDNCLQQLHNDKQAQWLLWQQHPVERSEFELTTIIDDVPSKVILDRFIIDKFDKIWIIDYKTSTPSAEQSLTSFYQQAKHHHQQQLQRYGQAVANLYDQPIELALYFPLCQGWHSWQYQRAPITLE